MVFRILTIFSPGGFFSNFGKGAKERSISVKLFEIEQLA